MKERNRARLEFLEKLESLIPNKKTQEALAEQIVKAKEALKKTEQAFDEKAKTGEESAKEEDPKKFKEANGASGEDIDMTASKSEDKPESKKEDDSESKSPEEVAKEQKKKEINYNLEVLTSKIEKVKDAQDKAKEEGKDEKIVGAIGKNYEEMKKAIEDLKAEKEKLGESFDSIEIEIWALDVAVTYLLEQIESGYLFE
jgi:hypothetical protein